MEQNGTYQRQGDLQSSFQVFTLIAMLRVALLLLAPSLFLSNACSSAYEIWAFMPLASRSHTHVMGALVKGLAGTYNTAWTEMQLAFQMLDTT